MDYKQITQELREYFIEIEGVKIYPKFCSRLAYSIQSLLKERNALLNELKGFCWCCKNVERIDTKEGIPLYNCKYMGSDQSSLYGRSGSGCRHWQWRGIQGGDKDA